MRVVAILYGRFAIKIIFGFAIFLKSNFKASSNIILNLSEFFE